MCKLGSGSIVSQLTQLGLIDSYQFEGVERRLDLVCSASRSFANGNVVSTYEPKT
jgi:hypothetical protein